LNAARCPDFLETACPIGALQAFDQVPTLLVWLDWVNWVPGLIFGALFSLSVFGWRQLEHRPRNVKLTLASGLIYLLAGPLFAGVLVSNEGSASDGLGWLMPAGLAAGLFGASALAASTRALAPSRLGVPETLLRIGTTGAIGAVTGAAFVTVCLFAGEAVFAVWPLAFAIWQIPVGLALRPIFA
jgi:hypothetical protein